MTWKAEADRHLSLDHLLPGLAASATLYRALRDSQTDIGSFNSNFAKGKRPRGIELRSTPVWMSISMFTSPSALESRMRRFSQLGSFIAEMRLEAGKGFAIAQTGAPGHVSVWGDPAMLDAAVIEVYPLDQ
jgi:hypothetical protein